MQVRSSARLKKLNPILVLTVVLITVASHPSANPENPDANLDRQTADPIVFEFGDSVTLTEKDRLMGTRKKREIVLNEEILVSHSQIGPVRTDRSHKPANASDAARRPVSFKPFKNLELYLEVEHLKSFSSGVNTYSGSISDVPEGYFILSAVNGAVTGQISLGRLIYEVSYDQVTGKHYVAEVDLLARPRHAPEPLSLGHGHDANAKYKGAADDSVDTNQPAFPGSHTMSLSNPVNGNVRILVLYSNGLPGISSLAANVLTSLNDSIRFNELSPDNYFSLAGTRQLTTGLDDCKADIRTQMINRQAPFQDLDTWMDTYDADVVLTIADVPTPADCVDLIGRVGGIAAGLLDENNPFAITFDTYALGDYTAAHEIGHVLGGTHAYFDLSPFPQYDNFARGYAREDLFWQTMMGGYDPNPSLPAGQQGNCVFDPDDGTNQGCVRLLKWSDSDPTKQHNGQAIGQANQRDMARALGNSMPTVAEWQDYPGVVPAAPGGFDVKSEFCFGQNRVKWSATSGATEYQAFFSPSSSFISPTLVYQGSNTAFSVNMAQGSPEYYRVRACNGNGCSSLSAQDVTTWFNNCY